MAEHTHRANQANTACPACCEEVARWWRLRAIELREFRWFTGKGTTDGK